MSDMAGDAIQAVQNDGANVAAQLAAKRAAQQLSRMDAKKKRAKNQDKAYLNIEDGKDKISCMFNPEKFSQSKSSNFESKPELGKGSPDLMQSYTGGSPGVFKIDGLLFDGTASTAESVKDTTDKLFDLLEPDKDLERPFKVSFHWGDGFSSFTGFLTSLNVEFVLFTPAGKPLRALASIEITEAFSELPKQNPTSGTPRPARSHQVLPGETLDRIAYRYYRDATMWRRLAQANRIKDPFGLVPGMRIDIPDKRED